MQLYTIKSKYWRAVKHVWHVDICRLYPQGILNTCYLQRKLPENQAIHRRLWWRTRYKLPVLFWLPLEFARWLNWRLWYASYLIRKSVLKHGQSTEAQYGVSIQQQQLHISYWAKHWMIHPDEAYILRLYHSEIDALQCIFGGEMQPYHRLLNELRGVEKSDYKLLADKTMLSTLMQSFGVPVVETFYVSKGNHQDLLKVLQKHPTLFCKLRSGSRGESAFFVEKTTTGLQGRSLKGRPLNSEQEVLHAWQELSRKGVLLIQPYLLNHPSLETLSPCCDTITLRVITRSYKSRTESCFGLLYVQVPGESMDREYWLLAVDLESGKLLDSFDYWNSKKATEAGQSIPMFLEGQPIPYWQEIKHYSELAHTQMPRVWGIAWDWVITPDGPKLLEGNSGWDLSPLNELGVNFIDLYQNIMTENQS